MQATIDRFGRMVLPKPIRDDFNLVPGTVLQVEEDREVIVLKPLRDQPPVKQKEGLLVVGGECVEGLEDALAEHRRKRLASFGAGK